MNLLPNLTESLLSQHPPAIRFAKALVAVMAATLLAVPTRAAEPMPMAVAQADFSLTDFRFADGKRLPTLRIHYRTLGHPIRDGSGTVTNAVILLHGTGGAGDQFLRPQFAGELFGPGQALDAARYFIVMPDDIGHGASSKPSDGLHARFPHYGYGDMVEAEHALVTQGLGIAHPRLILGTSMGCMHAFLWGERWPEAARALMPLACLPAPLVGRNRLWRRMAIEAIRADPAWDGGDYNTQPRGGLRTAQDLLTLAGAAPLPMQKALPTPSAVDAYLAGPVAASLGALDANDLIYALDASRDYDPSANLEAITAPLTWINSADDFINPPELGIAERAAPRLKAGRFVLLPISEQTHGHGTHTWAALWKTELIALLARSGP